VLRVRNGGCATRVRNLGMARRARVRPSEVTPRPQSGIRKFDTPTDDSAPRRCGPFRLPLRARSAAKRVLVSAPSSVTARSTPGFCGPPALSRRRRRRLTAQRRTVGQPVRSPLSTRARQPPCGIRDQAARPTTSPIRSRARTGGKRRRVAPSGKLGSRQEHRLGSIAGILWSRGVRTVDLSNR
jgi:hypothetical protein